MFQGITGLNSHSDITHPTSHIHTNTQTITQPPIPAYRGTCILINRMTPSCKNPPLSYFTRTSHRPFLSKPTPGPWKQQTASCLSFATFQLIFLLWKLTYTSSPFPNACLLLTPLSVIFILFSLKPFLTLFLAQWVSCRCNIHPYPVFPCKAAQQWPSIIWHYTLLPC